MSRRSDVKGPSLSFQPAADLIGAPLFLRQFFLDVADEAGLHFARRARCGGAPGGGFLLRLEIAIPLAAGIAFEFPRDRRTMHADQLRNLGFGVCAFQERVNLAAFVIGQVTIAFGHVCSGEMWKSHARIVFTWPPAYTAWLRAGDKAGSLKGACYARIASGDKPLTPPASSPACSAMPFMPACCISELKRRRKYVSAVPLNHERAFCSGSAPVSGAIPS